MQLRSDDIDYCQNPAQLPRCHARQYFTCPHCSFHLCFEHGQQHQEQVQEQAQYLHHRAKNLEQTIQDYQPVRTITDRVFQSLNEWKQRMFQFIQQYSEQVREHIEQAQSRLNEQWNATREEYLQMVENFILEPIEQLLRTPASIHPDDLRSIHTRLVSIQSQITDLLTTRDLLRINFDACSLTGDINISRGHFPAPKIVPSQPSASIENLPQLDQLELVTRFDTHSSDTSALGVSADQMVMTWLRPSTLLIFDSEHGLIRRVDVEPAFLSIQDILWCDYLNVFLIAGAALHTFDLSNNEIKQIFTPEDPYIWSIAVHRTDLFVCYAMGDSPLLEHRSLPSFHLVQSYTRAQLLPTNSASTIEVGRCIRSNEYHLAMTVRNLSTLEWRVDIFNFHLQRLFQGEVLGCAVHSDDWGCLLTPFRSCWWLVINTTSTPKTLTLLDRQARIRDQVLPEEGYNIAVLEEKQQVIIKDQKGLGVFRF